MRMIDGSSDVCSSDLVADNILKSMKDIILLSGLDPTNLVDGWASKMRALQTWLASRHLDVVVLEILNSKTDALIGRWDIDVVYTTGSGDGGFWNDTDHIDRKSVVEGKRVEGGGSIGGC